MAPFCSLWRESEEILLRRPVLKEGEEDREWLIQVITILVIITIILLLIPIINIIPLIILVIILNLITIITIIIITSQWAQRKTQPDM